MKTVFVRVLEAQDKAAALLGAARDPERANGRQRFEVAPSAFGEVPGSPFAYWVSEKVRSAFERFPRFDSDQRTALVGLQTSDDFRFVRAWWEVAKRAECQRWFGFAKGGAFSPFYADVSLLVGYSEGDQVGLQAIGRYGRGATHYFRPGLTWPRRTNGFSMRAMPSGCIFADKGPAAFVDNDDILELLALTGVTNSRAFGLLISLQLARTELAQSYEVGLIQTTPVPRLTDSDRAALARLGHQAFSLTRSLDTRTETSHAFALPALLQVLGADAAARAAAWSEHVHTVEAQLATIQHDIDERCFVLYGIDEADRRSMVDGFGGGVTEVELSGDVDEAENDAEEGGERNNSITDESGLAAELVSWAVGVAFGRFDVRLATSGRPMPPEPAPFDRLPACSPGMLTGGDGLPLARSPGGYPLAFPEAGVLVDDPGHAQDLPTAVRAVFDAVFGADAESWWNDVAVLLDPKGHDLRAWVAGSFFDHHLKRYSKSRRKAPIFWQLSTPSGRYSVWLYAHRLTPDSFFQLQNQSDGIVTQKLIHEERQFARIVQNAGASPSATARKEIAAQEAFVHELRAMLDEVKRIAPLWNPNLDDGVLLTMASLWRLVPHHKPWQKELKAKWAELSAAKYDWAHLAMYLWPERVVPKCAADRSLAIAHGLQEVFWVESGDGKFRPREAPVRPLDELIRERTSHAVKAALKSLLEAPVTGGSSRTFRKEKVNA